jgi:hypothetical protein
VTYASGPRTSRLLPSIFLFWKTVNVVRQECVRICRLFLMTSWRRCLGQGCMTRHPSPSHTSTTWLICSLYGSIPARPSTHVGPDENPSLMLLQHLGLHSVEYCQWSYARLTTALTHCPFMYTHCVFRVKAIMVQQSYMEVCNFRDNSIVTNYEVCTVARQCQHTEQ